MTCIKTVFLGNQHPKGMCVVFLLSVRHGGRDVKMLWCVIILESRSLGLGTIIGSILEATTPRCSIDIVSERH
jgi:hypothetical protein